MTVYSKIHKILFWLIIGSMSLLNLKQVLAASHCNQLKNELEFLNILHDPSQRSAALKNIQRSKENSNFTPTEFEEFAELMKQIAQKESEHIQANDYILINNKEPNFKIWAHKKMPHALIWKSQVYYTFFSQKALEAGFENKQLIQLVLHPSFLTSWGGGPHFNSLAGTYGTLVFEGSYTIRKNMHHASIHAHEWGHYLMNLQGLRWRSLAKNLKIDQTNLSIIDEFLADAVSISYTHQDRLSFLRNIPDGEFAYFDIFGAHKELLTPWKELIQNPSEKEKLKSIGSHGLSLYISQVAAEKLRTCSTTHEKLKMVNKWVKLIKNEFALNQDPISPEVLLKLRQTFETPYSTVEKFRNLILEN